MKLGQAVDPSVLKLYLSFHTNESKQRRPEPTAVKSNSPRWVHESFTTRKGFAWQEGYGAFIVSKSAGPKVIRYVRNQHRHHAKRSFKNEFIEFLFMKIEFNENIFATDDGWCSTREARSAVMK